MPELPKREYRHYLGIDPGYTGAIVLMDQAGNIHRCWDMPVVKTDKGRDFDPHAMNAIFSEVRMRFRDTLGCLEWPQTRPGEGHVGAERLGRGKGLLQMALVAHQFEVLTMPPNLWTQRLGLPGKKNKDWKEIRVGMYETYYPSHTGLIRGPKNGLKDGRLDAALIAHFARTRGVGAMRATVDRFGKDSTQAQAMILTGGRRKKKR